MQYHVPALFGGHAHQPQRQFMAPDGGEVALPVHVERLSCVVLQVVFVQVQFGAVDKLNAGGEDTLLLAQEGLIKLRRHRRFDAHMRQYARSKRHVFKHAVGAVRGPEVEAQLVQPCLLQRAQVLLVYKNAVGIHVLVDTGPVEALDDAVVDLDLHERLQIDVGDARGRAVDGEQQLDVLLAELGAADLPHALADGRYGVQHAVVVAEAAVGVALVGLADGAQARAEQAGTAAAGELVVRPHVLCAPLQRFKPRDPIPQRRDARLHRRFDLRNGGKGNLLLSGQKFLVLRERGEKLHPHQGVFFGNLHGRPSGRFFLCATRRAVRKNRPTANAVRPVKVAEEEGFEPSNGF